MYIKNFVFRGYKFTYNSCLKYWTTHVTETALLSRLTAGYLNNVKGMCKIFTLVPHVSALRLSSMRSCALAAPPTTTRYTFISSVQYIPLHSPSNRICFMCVFLVTSKNYFDQPIKSSSTKQLRSQNYALLNFAILTRKW